MAFSKKIEQDLFRFFSRHRLRFKMGVRLQQNITHCAFHSHGGFELVCHIRGGGTTTTRHAAPLEYKEGSVVIYPPGMVHNQTMHPPIEDACVIFSCPAPAPQPLRKLLHIPPLQDAALKEEILRLSQVKMRLTDAERLALDYRLTAVMIQFLQTAGGDQQAPARSAAEIAAQKARNHIENHFGRIQSLAEASAQAGISHHYLRHVFKSVYGISLVDWLTRTRIERAKELLTHSGLPLKSVASLCGFKNERYFSTRFRKSTGTSPGAFRSTHEARRLT
ncbi:MAG: AraC family transcriptional regulator [Verrucomicrobiae bacterium]|nr:AraC family transcriptional regulator [Verrucomicrobiae bacterium]